MFVPEQASARRRSAFALVVAHLTLSVPSATALAEPVRWTMETAEKAALERAPSIRSAEAARDTAGAYGTFAKVPRVGNPQINVRAMIGRPDDSAATYAVLLGLPFDVAGKRRAWRSEAHHILQEAEARLSAARNDTRAAAREAFAHAATAETTREVADERAHTARELVARVRARVDAHAATALDLALAASQHAEAEADLARAQRALLEAQDRFRHMLDLPPDTRISLTSLVAPALPAERAVSAAIRGALIRRKELAAWSSVDARWRSADARLRAEAVSPMTAAFEVEQQGNTAPKRSVGASVGMQLPIAQRNQGERAVARGEAGAAGTERELTEHAIAREVSTAYERLETALVELDALERDALPAAEQTLNMVQTLLESGAVDYFRLLTARSGAYALRSRRVEALREAWLCRIALERALGGSEHVR